MKQKIESRLGKCVRLYVCCFPTLFLGTFSDWLTKARFCLIKETGRERRVLLIQIKTVFFSHTFCVETIVGPVSYEALPEF